MEGAGSREAGPVVRLGGYTGSVVMQVDLVVMELEVVAVSRGATDVGVMPSGLSRRQSRRPARARQAQVSMLNILWIDASVIVTSSPRIGIGTDSTFANPRTTTTVTTT